MSYAINLNREGIYQLNNLVRQSLERDESNRARLANSIIAGVTTGVKAMDLGHGCLREDVSLDCKPIPDLLQLLCRDSLHAFVLLQRTKSFFAQIPHDTALDI
jgi:hypothetical protein